jgi:hypothetical protein
VTTELTAGQKAARTKKRRAAGKKAAQTKAREAGFLTQATMMKNGVVKIENRDTGESIGVLCRKDGSFAVHAHLTNAKVEVLPKETPGHD